MCTLVSRRVQVNEKCIARTHCEQTGGRLQRNDLYIRQTFHMFQHGRFPVAFVLEVVRKIGECAFVEAQHGGQVGGTRLDMRTGRNFRVSNVITIITSRRDALGLVLYPPRRRPTLMSHVCGEICVLALAACCDILAGACLDFASLRASNAHRLVGI